MNWRATIIAVVALGCMAGAGGLLHKVKANQKLGEPGLRVTRIAGSELLQIELPERVLDFTSAPISPSEVETNSLPPDTTYARRLYKAADGFQLVLGVVMMGTDRTSIHKPEFCLTSQGWRIVERDTLPLALERPPGYQLPTRRFTASFVAQDKAGRLIRAGGVYVFWFVADQRVTASHLDRMKQMTAALLRTGVMPRWAYVSCFATCDPGREQATYERMKRFLGAAVPKFQTAFPAQNGVAQTTASAAELQKQQKLEAANRSVSP